MPVSRSRPLAVLCLVAPYLAAPCLAVLLHASARAGDVSHWRLDGSLVDSGPEGADLTMRGAAVNYVAGATGDELDEALFLDGVAGYATASAGAFRNPGFSVAFWMRGAPDGGAAFYCEIDRFGPLFEIGADPTGQRVRVRVGKSDPAAAPDEVVSEPVGFGVTEWHHIAYVEAGRGEGILFIDGVAESTRLRRASVDRIAGTTVLGASFTTVRPAPCCYHDGAIDEVRTFDHALSLAEVADLSTRPCPQVRRFRVSPRTLPQSGGELIYGALGIQSDHICFLGDLQLDASRLSSSQLLATVPALDPGVYDASLRCRDGTIVGLVEDAVTISFEEPCPSDGIPVTSVEPSTIAAGVATELVIRGDGFQPTYLYSVGDGSPLTDVVVESSSLVRGRTPPLQPGAYPLLIQCSTGPTVAFVPGAVVVEAAPCPADGIPVSSIEPSLIAVGVPTDVTILGEGFHPSYVYSIGDGNRLTNVVVESPTRVRGRTPAMAAGVYPLFIQCETGQTVAFVPDAVEVSAALRLTEVVPGTASVDGGTAIEVRGTGLRAETRVLIGGAPLRDPQLVGRQGALVIVGVVPAGLAPGRVDVVAEDGRGASVLEDALLYVISDEPPGPDQIEASYAEGRVRVSWCPSPTLGRVAVQGVSGEIYAIADEGQSQVEFDLEAGLAGDLELHLIGEDEDGAPLRREAVFVGRRICDTPPPLEAIFQKIADRFGGLEYEDVEFSLYGDHPEAEVTRCADPEGGGAAFPPPVRAGALAPGVGYMRPSSTIGFEDSQVTTGFTLDQPAKRLEIALHYRKLEPTFGLELRGRIAKVGPEPGFVDEFTLPDTVLSDTNDWHLVTYYRADSDVGRGLEGEGDPGPQPCPGDECGGQLIPEGEYTLTFYAVGGSRSVPYFAVSADPSPEELLIPETPCPPYPLVRVRDVSEEESLPLITEVVATAAPVSASLLCPFGVQRVRVSALGNALDECNNSIPLTANDTRFEYSFTVFDGPAPTASYWSHRNWIELCLDCGCYEVEVRVRRTGCPVVRTYRREVVVTPPSLPCSPQRRFDYLYPQPAPGGMVGVVGLNEPGAPLTTQGYADERPMTFSVLVSPNCQCPDNSGCPSALVEEIEFDLAVYKIVGSPFGTFRYVPIGADFVVEDSLCRNQVAGAKYFLVHLDDLGEVPASDDLDSHDPTDVWLVGRARNSGEAWQPIGQAMQLHNPPDVLSTSSWRATFTEPGCYFFSVQSSEEPEQGFDLGASTPIDIQIPTVGDGEAESINVDGHDDNGVASGFASKFSLDNGVWSDEDGVGGMRGDVMGNEISGAPLQVGAMEAPGGGAGLFGDDGRLPEWEWCDGGNIFNYEFQEDIYKGVIYQGTIWVIPVSVWASIGFGFFFNVDYQLTFQLHPFSVLQGFEAGCPENSAGVGELSFADAYVYLLATAGISIPAAIRADILFGVASVAIELEPQTSFALTPWLEAHAKLPDPTFDIHMYLDARFKLYARLKACIFWELACISVPDEDEDSPIINQPLFECEDLAPGLFDCVCPACIETCDDPITFDCPDQADGDGGGAGGQFVPLVSVHELITIPVTAVSPDGARTLDVWMSADDANEGIVNLRESGSGPVRDFLFTLGAANPYFLDPTATYISNDVALVAFTETNGNQVEQVPELNGANTAEHVAAANRNAARANIRVHPVAPGITSSALLINSGEDVSESSADLADWRADGSASIAGAPGSQSAWLAWVRYEEEFLEDRGMREVVVPCDDCPPRQPFTTAVVPDLQPKIDSAAIYVHEITYDQANGVVAVPGSVPTAISTGGINIEPRVAYLPDASLAACVWVHDGLHQNLLDDNRGRNLRFAHWDASLGAWTSPVDVIRPGILDEYPGVLGPRIAMRRKDGTVEGIVAFTALPEGAEPNDTGLGGLRYLYTVRFEQSPSGDFDFADPVRIRGACQAPVYAYDYEVGSTLDELVDPQDSIAKHGPEWVILFNERGVPGTLKASGDVMMSVLGRGQDEWTAPVCMSDGTRVIQNVSGVITPQGGVRSLYLDAGAAQRPSLAFQAIVPEDERVGVNVLEATLGPDLVLASCKLSQQFPGPGGRVTATVRVENRGFTSSAMDAASGRNLARVEIVYHEADGSERVVASRPLTLLEPGDEQTLELEIEMPLDPVELGARIEPNPDDIDPANDSARCDFGAPTPDAITCDVDQQGETLRVVVEWESPVLYDDIFVYRDGALLTKLPGAFERYVDLAPPLGLHRYEVRGSVGASTSMRAVCELIVEPEVVDPEPGFQRGDTNLDRTVDISDAVATLSWLFTGGAVPACPDAVDANDSGQTDISDAVFTLAYLFTGGPVPPAPGPDACGADPTADALEDCEAPECP